MSRLKSNNTSRTINTYFKINITLATYPKKRDAREYSSEYASGNPYARVNWALDYKSVIPVRQALSSGFRISPNAWPTHPPREFAPDPDQRPLCAPPPRHGPFPRFEETKCRLQQRHSQRSHSPH